MIVELALLLTTLPPLQTCHADVDCTGAEHCVDFQCISDGVSFPDCSAEAACNCPADTTCVVGRCKSTAVHCRAAYGACMATAAGVRCECGADDGGNPSPAGSSEAYAACTAVLPACEGESATTSTGGSTIEVPPVIDPICQFPSNPSFAAPAVCYRSSDCPGNTLCVLGQCEEVSEPPIRCFYDDGFDAAEGEGIEDWNGCPSRELCVDEYCKDSYFRCATTFGGCGVNAQNEIHCGCHGASTEGADGPDVPPPPVLASGTDAERYQQCMAELTAHQCEKYGPGDDAADGSDAADRADGAGDDGGDAGTTDEGSPQDGSDAEAADASGSGDDAAPDTTPDDTASATPSAGSCGVPARRAADGVPVLGLVPLLLVWLARTRAP